MCPTRGLMEFSLCPSVFKPNDVTKSTSTKTSTFALATSFHHQECHNLGILGHVPMAANSGRCQRQSGRPTVYVFPTEVWNSGMISFSGGRWKADSGQNRKSAPLVPQPARRPPDPLPPLRRVPRHGSAGQGEGGGGPPRFEKAD